MEQIVYTAKIYGPYLLLKGSAPSFFYSVNGPLVHALTADFLHSFLADFSIQFPISSSRIYGCPQYKWSDRDGDYGFSFLSENT